MYTIKDVIAMEVAPALGCTEPSAVALGAAAAAMLLNGKPVDRISLQVNPNIYKNGVGVFIPGAGENRGIDMAAALGVYSGDPDLGLEVLDPVDESALRRAKALVENHHVKLGILGEKTGIYIKTTLQAGDDQAESIIEELHDNIVALTLNNEPVDHQFRFQKSRQRKTDLKNLEAWLTGLSLQELLDLLEELDEEDLKQLRAGVAANLKLAEFGLANGSGLGVGAALNRMVREKILKKDMVLSARILTSAAADARMSGVRMPAMSSAGSGNHGLTAILPIWAVRDYLDLEDETEVLKAIALSHCVTGYVKAHTGRLGASCGCSTAAGAGAAAGIAYLMGGCAAHIAGAVKNLISDLAGVICDGAKTGCALKLSTAAGTAVQSALFALRGIHTDESNGIVGFTSEDTMRNIGELCTEGMLETDRTILNIMTKKQQQAGLGASD